MNHDYAHCIDCTDDCPKDCFRAQLVREALDKHLTMVCWMHFKGNELVAECREYARQKRQMRGDSTNRNFKPCPRCGAKNSHAIFSHTEKVSANDRTLYVNFVGIRCDDCGFNIDGYLNPDEAVTMWNAIKGVTK